MRTNISKSIDDYKKGYLSIGEFAKVLNISHKEAMKLLSSIGVDVIGYDFEDDMKFIKRLFK